MQISQLAEMAEQMLDMHRRTLLVDPFFKITIEISEGDYISRCTKETSALTWKIRLNPARHNGFQDIQYSIFESLLLIIFDSENTEKNLAIIARLTQSFCDMFSGSDDDDE